MIGIVIDGMVPCCDWVATKTHNVAANQNLYYNTTVFNV
jgi:hypothetical protein